MPRPKGSPVRQPKAPQEAANYTHPEADLALRPEVGTQAQFKKHKLPQTYRYDSSLSPVLEYDGQNPAREPGEALIAEILAHAASLERGSQAASTPAGQGAAKSSKTPDPSTVKRPEGRAPEVAAILAAAQKLKALFKPFLNWTGKAERLSTRAIIETLTGHKRDRNLDFMADLFADPRHSVSDDRGNELLVVKQLKEGK